MREKEIEKYLKRKVEALGGMCIKFTSPSMAGVPDRIVVCKGRVVFIEMKNEEGRLSKIQKERMKQLLDCGAMVDILHSKDDVDFFMRWLDGI